MNRKFWALYSIPIRTYRKSVAFLKRRFTVRETAMISFGYFILVTLVFSALYFIPYQQDLDQLQLQFRAMNSRHYKVSKTLEALAKNPPKKKKEEPIKIVKPGEFLKPLKEHYLSTLLALFQHHHLALIKSQIPQPLSTPGPFSKSQIVLELEGEYSDLGNFLFHLDHGKNLHPLL